MRYRYTGGDGDRYLVGVPARDLTDDDVTTLGLNAEDLVASGIYVPSKNGTSAPAPPPVPEPVPAGGIN